MVTSNNDSISQAPKVETDPRFPSGKWIGWFKQGRKYEMSVHLTFRNGIVVANGSDMHIGKFTFNGQYSVDDGSCWWRKVYQSRPKILDQVFYKGFNEGKGIWGVWEFPAMKDHPLMQGGFCLWPEGWPDPFGGDKLDEQIDLPIDIVTEYFVNECWEDESVSVR